jgi:predicted CXXCH cytochrome family protein
VRFPPALIPALLYASVAGASPQAAPPPTVRTPTCTEGGCHSDQTSYDFLHGPAAAGFCSACHEYTDVQRHAFELKRTGADMCSFCHMGKANLAGLVVHKPVQDEQCIGCHDPHGSNRRFMLSATTNRQMCLTCHAPILEGRSAVHGPIREDDCLQCHVAHASIHENLLTQPQDQLCRSCHAAVFEPMIAARAAAAAAPPPAPDEPVGAAGPPGGLYIHQPAEANCAQCHEVHASNHPQLLKDEPLPLCVSCHEPVRLAAANATVHHSAVTDNRACLNCHAPHHSPFAHLLTAEPLNVCMECHMQNIPREDGTVVASLAELAAPGAKLHAPIAQGDCTSCHSAHGGNHAFLLDQPFPRDFYHAFSRDDYGLCFECHDARLATEITTSDATRFRNGDRNLHFVHVTKQGDAARNCRVCHTVHASTRPALTRATTPFGEWNIPIEFQATNTGGSCAAGCHRAYRFDRVTPVDNFRSPPSP